MHGVIYYFGQAYGDGTYSGSAYGCTQAQIDAGTCATTGGGSAGGGTGGPGGSAGGGAGGSLADTGIALVGIVTLACLLVFVALVVRIWRRPKLATQEVQAETIVPASDTEQQPRD